MQTLVRFACGCVFLVSASLAQAQGWGTLTGQYVFDGAVPQLKPLVAKGDPTAKDPAVCAVADIPDESLVVDPTTKGIRDIVVYLRRAPAVIHPDLKVSTVKEVVVDQKGCRYVPHVIAVRTDQKVKCISSDAASHNVHTYPFKNSAENFVITANDQTGNMIQMKLAESLPVQVKCDIHAWMRGIWVVTDHPYVAITDEQGRFKIENIPAGKHTFTVWQDKSGYIESKLEVDIKPGATLDLGTVKVPAAKFAK